MKNNAVKKIVSILIVWALLITSVPRVFGAIAAENDGRIESVMLENDAFSNFWEEYEQSGFEEVPDVIPDASPVLDQEALTESRTVLPSVYDPRGGPFIPVKNQGTRDICWSYATMGSLEASYLKQYNTQKVFSENYYNYLLASDAFNNNPVNTYSSGRVLNGGGSWIENLGLLTEWKGPVLESEFPTTVTGYITPDQLDIEPDVHVQGFHRLPGIPVDCESSVLQAKIEAMKDVIYNDGSLIISLKSANCLSPLGTFWNSFTKASYTPVSMGDGTDHVVMIVGWDDNYSKANFQSTYQPSQNGAFIVRNSWGSTWGDGGYFYLSYEDWVTYQSMGAVSAIESADNYDNLYTLTDFDYGFSTAVRSGSGPVFLSSVYIANVYPKSNQENEYIEAVGVMTSQYGNSYEIYINPDSSSLLPSNFVLAESGTLNLPGYHTIELDTPVLLDNDCDDFAVVVKLTAPNDEPGVVIPVEAKHFDHIEVNAGESFCSADFTANSMWTDWSSERPNEVPKNFFTKAYTKAYDKSLVTKVNSSSVVLNGTDGVSGTYTHWVNAEGNYPAPISVEGKVMAPIRFISETYWATVSYTDSRITITYKDKSIAFYAGQSTATITTLSSGVTQTVTWNVTPFYLSNVIYAPIRDVFETAFGCQVRYIERNNAAYVVVSDKRPFSDAEALEIVIASNL